MIKNIQFENKNGFKKEFWSGTCEKGICIGRRFKYRLITGYGRLLQVWLSMLKEKTFQYLTTY